MRRTTRILALLVAGAALVPARVAGAPAPGGTPPADPRAKAYSLYLEAEDLAAAGRSAEARGRLEQVLELDPKANVVRARLARVCLESGDLICAENEALRAVAIDDDEIGAHKVLAELSLQRYRGGGDRALLERGLSHLRRATTIEPRDPWAWAVWVRVLGYEGRISEAENVAARAASTPGLDPASPWLALAHVLIGQGRQVEAVSLLERVTVGGLAAVPLLELLADLKTSSRDLAGLEAALTRLRQLQPEDADVARRLGKARADLGDFHGALEPLRAAFEIRPGDPLVRRDLATVLVRMGQGERALVVLEALAEVYRTPHTYLIWARAAEQAGRPALAARRLMQLLDRLGVEERASFAPALQRRAARNFLQAREPEQALSALEGTGEDAASWRVRLAAHRSLGDPRVAAESLRRRVDGTDDGARLVAVLLEHVLDEQGFAAALGLARGFLPDGEARAAWAAVAALELTGWGHPALAVAVLDLVDAPEPVSLAWLRARGGILYAAGRHDEAERVYRRILELDPDDHSALNDLGYLLAVTGSGIEEAQRLCERAVSLRPDEPAYLDSLGWAYHLAGRSAEALDYLRRAAVGADERSMAEIHEHLGDVYAALGQRERAIAQWRAAQAFAGGGGNDRIEAKIRELEGRGGGGR